jgi:myosin-15
VLTRLQAVIALRNLKQTMRYGGRRELPDVTEIAAIISGKYTKIQKLYMPGDRTKSIKINAITVGSSVAVFI